jgi:hypothetical protein
MTRQGHIIADAVAALEAENARLRDVLERIANFHNLTLVPYAEWSAKAHNDYERGAHSAFAQVAAIAGKALETAA